MKFNNQHYFTKKHPKGKENIEKADILINEINKMQMKTIKSRKK